MHLAEVGGTVACCIEIDRFVERAGGHGVVGDEAGAADEMSMPPVVDRAVVVEILEIAIDWIGITGSEVAWPG
jgi:hypothetical protein